MNDDEIIAANIKDREESVSFFSSARKQERERWIVNQFLNNLGLRPSEAEVSSSVDEPPDVLYQDARFEVKEIMDPGKRRHAEHKQSLRKAREAKAVADLLESCEPHDITHTELCEQVEKHISTLKRYAPATKSSLDLLFYVTVEDVRGYVSSERVAAADFEKYGWRSVSFLAGPLAVVLYSRSSAPSFLRSHEGNVVRQ